MPAPPSLDPRLAAFRPDLADARLRGRIEASAFVEGRPARLTAPSAPVRRRPGPEAPLDTEALRGERLRVFEERDGYAWVQLERDGYVGYLPANSVGPDGPEPSHVVSVMRSFVYPAPDLKQPPLAHLSLGAGVLRNGEDRNGFVPIEGGGWVFARHLRGSGEFEPDPVAVAERLLGTPYLWGGRTSLGLDCSGLVQLAFGAAGVPAPRDSDMQEAGFGDLLEFGPNRRGLRRGDLVFWRGHVGIMRDEATLLHANGNGMQVESEPLDEAERRIRAAGGGPATSARRPPAS